jgi:rod shape-determining protein MreD
VRRSLAVRVVGPTQWVVYPALAVIAITVVLATPVELFGLKLPEPVLPLVLAFAWPLIRPSMIAPAVLFGLGLFLDLFWGGTLGVWPLCLLSVYGVVLASRNLLAGQETQILFVWFAVCALVAFVLAYLVVTVTAGRAPSLLSLLGQVVPTLLLFPVADWMIQRFDDGDVRFR